MSVALVYKFSVVFSIVSVFLLIAWLIAIFEFSRVTPNSRFTIGPRFGHAAPHNRIFGYTSTEALAYFHNDSLGISQKSTDELRNLDLYKKVLTAKRYLTILYGFGLCLLVFVLDAGEISRAYVIFLGFLIAAYALMGVTESGLLIGAIKIFEDVIEVDHPIGNTPTDVNAHFGASQKVRSIHRKLTFCSMVTVAKFWSVTFIIALLMLGSLDGRVDIHWL